MEASKPKSGEDTPSSDGGATSPASENAVQESSVSCRSSVAPPVRNAKKKIRKIKKMVAESKAAAAAVEHETPQTAQEQLPHTTPSQPQPPQPTKHAASKNIDEEKSRIRAKIDEQKEDLARTKHQQQLEAEIQAIIQQPNTNAAATTTARDTTPRAIMKALTADIASMEAEAEELLAELERVRNKESSATAAEDPASAKAAKPPKPDGSDEEFLAGRIAALEAENHLLKTRLQSGQATVDAIRADIAGVAASNQDCKKATRAAKAALRPLQQRQQDLREQIQDADTELSALEARAGYKRTFRSVEKETREVFRTAAREILDLQKQQQHRLKKQQQKQTQKQRMRRSASHGSNMKRSASQGSQGPHRPIQRQNSWWQLDTTNPEKVRRQPVRAHSIHAVSEIVIRNDDDHTEDSNRQDTSSASSLTEITYYK